MNTAKVTSVRIFAKNCQKLPKTAKNCQKLPKQCQKKKIYMPQGKITALIDFIFKKKKKKKKSSQGIEPRSVPQKWKSYPMSREDTEKLRQKNWGKNFCRKI